MKGERRWTQGGIQANTRASRARPPDETFLANEVFLGDPFWDPPWISDRRQNRQIGPSESIRLAPLFHLPHPPPHLCSKRATNNHSMTYEHVQHVRSYAWHIVGAGTEGPARGRGWWGAMWGARLVVSSVLVGRLTKLEETADGREVRRSLTATADRPPPLSGGLYNTKRLRYNVINHQ